MAMNNAAKRQAMGTNLQAMSRKRDPRVQRRQPGKRAIYKPTPKRPPVIKY